MHDMMVVVCVCACVCVSMCMCLFTCVGAWGKEATKAKGIKRRKI